MHNSNEIFLETKKNNSYVDTESQNQIDQEKAIFYVNYMNNQKTNPELKDLDISSLSENTSDISNTASLIKINGEYYFVGANGNKVKAAKWMIPNGGSGQGYSNPARIKSIRPYKRSYKRGGYGNTSVYLSSISSFKPANIKHITNTSTDISTAINYIIGYLEAITNNTAGANDKLTALRNLSNSNQIYVGTTNNNINGKPTKSTTVVKSANNGQINDSISRGMQIAQKIAKG